ncbi:MAG: hypothetical protein IT381_28520 [Deltaproteobacteria bacterium]|nr:hypothetical protein [Deltaproteobacteria bacterium]
MVPTRTVPGAPIVTTSTPSATPPAPATSPLPDAAPLRDDVKGAHKPAQKAPLADKGAGVADGFVAKTRDADAATDAAKPFGEYALPSSEQTIVGQPQDDTDALQFGLVSAVVDVVKGLVVEEGVQWMRDRGAHLEAHPQDGVFTALVGDAFKNQLGPALAETMQASPFRAQIAERYGEAAARLTDGARGMAADFMLNQGLLGTSDAAPAKLFGNCVAASLGIPAAQAQAMVGASLRKMGLDGGLGKSLSFTGAGGAPDVSKIGALLGAKGPGVLEASLEYFIAHAGRILKGDGAKDLEQMSKQLSALKEEKKGLIGALLAKEGSVLGLQLSGKEASDKAKAAQECAQAWQLVGSIFALIVVIVVAIVVTVFSCGTAAPAAALAVGATASATVGAVVIAAALAISIEVATVLAALVVICTIVVAVITFVMTIPQLIQAVAMVLEALGMEGAAQSLKDAAAAFQKFMDESGLGTALMVISIICTIYCAVISFAVAGASVAATTAAEAAEAGFQVAGEALAEATAEAFAEYSTMAVVTTCVEAGGLLLQGTAKIVASFAMRDMARMQHEVELLRAQLAEVELEIKQLVHRMDTKKTEEEEIKEDVSDHHDMEQRITENLNKAADSYAQILSVTNFLS